MDRPVAKHTATVPLLSRYTRYGQLLPIILIARWMRVKARKMAFTRTLIGFGADFWY